MRIRICTCTTSNYLLLHTIDKFSDMTSVGNSLDKCGLNEDNFVNLVA